MLHVGQVCKDSIDFTQGGGTPLDAVAQLVAILPPSSAHLLPPAYRSLSTSPQSPLRDLFPPTWKLDVTGYVACLKPSVCRLWSPVVSALAHVGSRQKEQGHILVRVFEISLTRTQFAS